MRREDPRFFWKHNNKLIKGYGVSVLPERFCSPVCHRSLLARLVFFWKKASRKGPECILLLKIQLSYINQDCPPLITILQNNLWFVMRFEVWTIPHLWKVGGKLNLYLLILRLTLMNISFGKFFFSLLYLRYMSSTFTLCCKNLDAIYMNFVIITYYKAILLKETLLFESNMIGSNGLN